MAGCCVACWWLGGNITSQVTVSVKWTERPDQARIHELWLRDPAGDDGLPALVHRDRDGPGTLRTHRPAAPS